MIEGIECEGYDFCLGVQWHPEYQQHQQDTQLLNALVSAASRYKHSMRSSARAMTDAMTRKGKEEA